MAYLDATPPKIWNPERYSGIRCLSRCRESASDRRLDLVLPNGIMNNPSRDLKKMGTLSWAVACIKGESGGGRDDETRNKFGDERWGMKDEGWEKGRSQSVSGERVRHPKVNVALRHVEIRVLYRYGVTWKLILVTSRLLWYDSRLFAWSGQGRQLESWEVSMYLLIRELPIQENPKLLFKQLLSPCLYVHLGK